MIDYIIIKSAQDSLLLTQIAIVLGAIGTGLGGYAFVHIHKFRKRAPKKKEKEKEKEKKANRLASDRSRPL